LEILRTMSPTVPSRCIAVKIVFYYNCILGISLEIFLFIFIVQKYYYVNIPVNCMLIIIHVRRENNTTFQQFPRPVFLNSKDEYFHIYFLNYCLCIIVTKFY